MLTMGRMKFRSLQRKAAPAQHPPFRQEERTRGCRRGAEIRAHPRGARSKAFSGGRLSAGEVPQGLPPVEDPWSLGEPLASPLPHWRRPWFPFTIDGGQGWRKAGPSSGDMKQGQYL